jgi:hypothetical protein
MYIYENNNVHVNLMCRVFQEKYAIHLLLRLVYIDITKHTHLYLELNGYGDNFTGKNVVFLWFHVLYLFNVVYYVYAGKVRPCADSQGQPSARECAL